MSPADLQVNDFLHALTLAMQSAMEKGTTIEAEIDALSPDRRACLLDGTSKSAFLTAIVSELQRTSSEAAAVRALERGAHAALVNACEVLLRRAGPGEPGGTRHGIRLALTASYVTLGSHAESVSGIEAAEKRGAGWMRFAIVAALLHDTPPPDAHAIAKMSADEACAQGRAGSAALAAIRKTR